MNDLDPEVLIKCIRVIGIGLLVALFLLGSIAYIDGPNHRLGTIQLSQP